MMGYGMAKAAVHQLTKSLGDKKSGLPENSVALALLPITLDTPMKYVIFSRVSFKKQLFFKSSMQLNFKNVQTVIFFVLFSVIGTLVKYDAL